MGVYFKAVFLQNDGTTPADWMDAHEYDLGAKLTEHCSMRSPLMKAFSTLLIPGAKYYRQPVVWAGDNALKGEYIETDEFCNWETSTVYRRANKKALYVNTDVDMDPDFKYLVNYTKKQYIDLSTCEQYHPLALMTMEGDCELRKEKCDGDFRLVGSWARDYIGIEKKPLSVDFKKINFNIIERLM